MPWVVAFLALTCAGSVQAGINRWTPVGVEGGIVTLVAPDPSVAGTFWASVDGRLFRTTDGGASWIERSAGIPVPPSTSEFLNVAFDASQPGTILAASESGLFRTTDAGGSWQLQVHWHEIGTTSFVAGDPFMPGTFYLMPWGGTLRLLRSTDHGQTWAPIGSPLGSGVETSSAFAIDPNVPGRFYRLVFAQGSTQLRVSQDAGATWQVLGAGLPAHVFGRLLLAPTSPATLYVSGYISGELYRSVDAGASFSQSGLGRTDLVPLAVDPTDPAIVYGVQSLDGGSRLPLFRTPDGGATWVTVPVDVPGLPTPHVAALAVDPTDPDRLLVGSGTDGMLASTDGGATWAHTSHGLPGQQAMCRVTVVPGTPAVYTLAGFGLWKSDDRGVSWTPRSPEMTPGSRVVRFTLDPSDPETVYAATSEGVFKSIDGALSWAAASTGLTDPYVRTVAVDPLAPQTLYAATPAGLFRSLDGGGTWALRNAGIDTSEIAVDPFLSTTLYFDRGIATSSDAGLSRVVTPTFMPLLFPPPGLILAGLRSTLALDPTTPGRAYLGVDASLFDGTGTTSLYVTKLLKSDDRLATTMPLLSLGPTALALDPSDPLTLYVGLDRAVAGVVRRTRDGGSTFELFGGDLPGIVCDLAVDPATATVYAGTSREPGMPFDPGLHAISLPLCTTAAECDDGEDCTVDTCVGGRCSYTARPDASPCTGQNPCPFTSICGSGICATVIGPAAVCDDGNACTDDRCVLPGTCAHFPLPGCQCTTAADCNDGDACTIDQCTTFGLGRVCTHAPIVCDDGDPCTADACSGGVCTTTPSCTDRTLASGRLVLAQRGGRLKLVFRTRDPAVFVPAGGGPGDPVTSGATIELFSAAAGSASLDVPPGLGSPGWQLRTGAATGYRYTNLAAPAGPSPVRMLQLQTNPLLKILARDTGLALTAPLGPVGIRVTTGDLRHCARLAPAVDVAGRFVGRTTLPLADCTDASLGN